MDLFGLLAYWFYFRMDYKMIKLVRRGLVATRKRTHRRYEWGNALPSAYTPLNDRQNPALAVSQLFLKGVK